MLAIEGVEPTGPLATALDKLATPSVSSG